MLRFTIRDLCSVMFVVGFSLWTLKYRRQILAVQRTYLERATEEIALREQAERELVQTKQDAAEFSERMSRVELYPKVVDELS